MADKYINEVGLQTIKEWVKSKFGNKIEAVKVNGTELTPDAQKAVNIEAAQMEPSRNNGELVSMMLKQGDNEFSLTKYGTARIKDELSEEFIELATQLYVDEHGGKIDKIKVNGAEQTITDKEVDLNVAEIAAGDSSMVISGTFSGADDPVYFNVSDGYESGLVFTLSGGALSSAIHKLLASTDYVDTAVAGKADTADIPTAVSDLQNDSGYQTATEVQSAIGTAVSSAYKYKGSVANYDALPTNASVGDVYDTQDTGMNYAWDGTKWDELGAIFDTSTLWSSTAGQTNSLIAMTNAEVLAILNA